MSDDSCSYLLETIYKSNEMGWLCEVSVVSECEL